MEKNIENYLPFYLGCTLDNGNILKAVHSDGSIETLYRGHLTNYWSPEEAELKPILRPLSDMTEEELQECGNMIYDFSGDPELNDHKWQDFEIGLAPEQFHYLLSKHFDLFGLIDAGLAIDSTTIKQL